MITHGYTTDTQTKAAELASSILSAAAPPEIAAACGAVEEYLKKHTAEQTRWFFSITFPTLICRIFGFDDSASSAPKLLNGWLDVATSSNDIQLSGRIFNLLSPNGVLLSTVSAVDRLSLVKYLFPVERLPEWVKYMLQNERYSRTLGDFCPLFKNRVKEDVMKGSSFQIQLNVFEYYVFWFAFYPVCRGNNEGSEATRVGINKKFRLEKWTCSIPGLASTKREIKQKNEGNLFVKLLYAYLCAYVPDYDVNAYQPYRSSLLHFGSGFDSNVIERAEFFVNVLIHFWLVDNDFSPVPASLSKSFGVTFPFCSVLGEMPPTSGLGEVVNVFVKYLNLNSSSLIGGLDLVDYTLSPGDKTSASVDALKSRDATPNVHSVNAWNSLIQRPLYRFILRTFLFCPLESSIKNVSQVFSLWISYLEPWKSTLEEFAELEAKLGLPIKHKQEAALAAREYSSSWQGYVLANYLFYSSLVMHFIGFAHKFLHTDAEVIVQMVLKVINILTSSKEMTDLIKNIDVVYHMNPSGQSKSTLSTLYRFVPLIREQLKDWEDGLCESDADGSFLHENWNKDLRLFGNSEDGGQQLLQLFVLRAESELQAISGGNHAQKLQYVDSLKAQLSCLFGTRITMSSQRMHEPSRDHHTSRDNIFTPKSFGNRMVADIKYKGDWMNRPISDDEVAWLAHLLVKVSGWLNELLGLNHVDNNSHENPGQSYVELSTDTNISGVAEIMKLVFWSFLSVIVALSASGVKFMKRHGLRVNLRMLASKKVVMLVLIGVACSAMRRVFA
ncbi:hypothetical protein LIER_18358 [Lithospermum erythrorhizon]|uniref:Sphingomyelin phosphodiesterase 4 n=1 Tax=Lithospermum erythrorhizon TaxID=34254 RepID=A0AAV3QG98_LITER